MPFKSFVLSIFAVFACAACAFAKPCDDCANTSQCCETNVVALTYPEPYNGEERVAQRVTVDVGPRPIGPPPRWVPVRPAPPPRPIGPPPRPVPPPRPRWIWW
jgi:hypothetical protein